MTDTVQDTINLLRSATQIIIDANLKLAQTVRTYCECVGKEDAQALDGQAVQTQVPGPDRAVELSTNDGPQPRSASSTAHDRKCSVYDAVVTRVELVGIAPEDGRSARGVRIHFEVLNPPESAPSARTAEVYYQLGFKGGTTLREAVDRLLRRPLTFAEAKSDQWMQLILHKRCGLSAYLGVARETGKPLKYMYASVV